MTRAPAPYLAPSVMAPIIVYGPPACGKSIRRHDIAFALNRDYIADWFHAGAADAVPENCILLTNDPRFEFLKTWEHGPQRLPIQVVQFADVCKLMNPTKIERTAPQPVFVAPGIERGAK